MPSMRDKPNDPKQPEQSPPPPDESDEDGDIATPKRDRDDEGED